MKLLSDELNLFFIAFLSLETIVIFILFYKLKFSRNEHRNTQLQNESDSNIFYLKSKYASMGETVGNIAHQWKQPLDAVGSIQTGIKAALLFQGKISKKNLLNSVETSLQLINHLGETIDTFYSFLSQKNSIDLSFKIADELEKVRIITEYSFKNSNITLNIVLEINPTVHGNANEFTHAMLNLILNAKDAFEQASIEAPTITVHVKGKEETCTIVVSDNAGGIRLQPIEMVFDLYITTKESGSGLGLFMTKNIIENRFGGKISVENRDGGACFSIELPYMEYCEDYIDKVIPDEKLSLERISQLSRKIIELEDIGKVLQKWTDIFKKAHWGIAMRSDKSNTFELTNDAFNLLYGYTHQEMIDLSISDLCTQESLPKLSKFMEDAFEKGYATFESVHKRKDGSTFPVSIELIVVKDDEGEILYHIANVWDITKLKHLEELKDNDRMRLFFERQLVGMAITSPTKGWLHTNEKLQQMLGYTHKELSQLTWADVTHPDDLAPDVADFERMLSGEINSYIVEKRFIRKDGSIIHAYLSIGCVRTEDRTVDYVLALIEDITERKEAQALLEQREKEFRSLAENIPDNIARWDTKGRYLYINPVHERTLGISSAEIIGTYITDKHTAVKEAIEQVAATGEKESIHQAILGKNGRKEIHDVTLVPEKSADGQIVSILGIGRDMTDIYSLQDEIAAREEQFRTLVENLPDKIIRYDKKCRAIYVSPSMAEIFGDETVAMLMDKTPIEAHQNHHYDAEPYQRKLEHVIATGEKEYLTHEVLLPTGEIQYGQVHFVAERDQKGEICGALAIGTDITERKRAEAAIIELNTTLENRVLERTLKLQESEEMFRAIVENSPDVISRYDLQMRRTYVNPMMEFLMGKPAEELVGKEPKYFSPLPDVESFIQIFNAVIHSGSEFEHEGPYKAPWGEIRWGNQRLVPAFDADHNVTSVMVIGRDMTERKNTEKQLKLLETAINNAEEAIYIIDNTSSIIYVNDAACDMLNYTRDELVNMKIYEVDVDLSKEELHAIERGINMEKTMIFETKQKTKNAHIIDVQIKLTYFEYDGVSFGISLVKEIYKGNV